jgi:hypothetical protein
MGRITSGQPILSNLSALDRQKIHHPDLSKDVKKEASAESIASRAAQWPMLQASLAPQQIGHLMLLSSSYISLVSRKGQFCILGRSPIS